MRKPARQPATRLTMLWSIPLCKVCLLGSLRLDDVLLAPFLLLNLLTTTSWLYLVAIDKLACPIRTRYASRNPFEPTATVAEPCALQPWRWRAPWRTPPRAFGGPSLPSWALSTRRSAGPWSRTACASSAPRWWWRCSAAWDWRSSSSCAEWLAAAWAVLISAPIDPMMVNATELAMESSITNY